jgi:hypothetical protein
VKIEKKKGENVEKKKRKKSETKGGSAKYSACTHAMQ